MSATLETAEQAPSRRAGRVVTSLVLVGALVATAITRSGAISARQAVINSAKPAAAVTADTISASTVDSMPSFATALLLGGLRGPLVMMLWTTSENQKQEHDLEDFDTKIEWIRLLQPEFDTVHLFQIWNKAYNISVQMSNLSNKYATIIDAIDYGRKVESERPDDISIISAIASVYGDKLGSSAEHVYYRRRVRRETQTLVRLSFPPSRADAFRAAATNLGWIEDEAPLITNTKAGLMHVLLEKTLADRVAMHFSGPDVTSDDVTFRQSQQSAASATRQRLDSMLDINGDILPSLIRPRFPRPADLADDQPWYDGSELQFLKPFLKPNGPSFPYGLPPQALEYNGYKRAQALQTLWDERHIQSGDQAIDARVGLSLERWAKDEWERGRHFELRMWGRPASAAVEPVALEKLSANMPSDAPSVDDASRDAALYSFALSGLLWSDALDETEHHMAEYPESAQTFFSHIDDATAFGQLMRADHDYIAAMMATGAERQKLIASDIAQYNHAMQHLALIVLKYYIEDAAVGNSYPLDPQTGQTYSRTTIGETDPSTYLSTLDVALKANSKYLHDPVTGVLMISLDSYHDQREDYLNYIAHCAGRLTQLGAPPAIAIK